MALSGRMLEPAKPPKKGSASKTSEAGEDEENGEEDDKKKGVWKGLNLTIEAALQVAHAISTHEARPEVDYFIAADDVKDVDAGGAHIGEALFASACFYKYFSIHWETLLENLKGFPGNQEYLAAHTVGAFLRGAALVTPTGKQNSFAAHNLPDGILVEIREKRTPISYANAFAKPAARGRRDLVSESIAQLGQYVLDMDTGYGKSDRRFWFSPNLRHSLSAQVPDEKDPKKKKEVALTDQCFRSLDDLIPAVIARIGNGYDWSAVQKVTINPEAGA
jgi:hypothetical protein